MFKNRDKIVDTKAQAFCKIKQGVVLQITSKKTQLITS